MILQLKNGSIIEMSTEKYLSMSDAEIDYLNSSFSGEYIDNPFHGSVLGRPSIDELDDEILEELDFDEETDFDLDIDTDLLTED